MAVHTIAYHKAGASTTLLPLTPVEDTQITTAGYDVTVPELNHIVALAAFGSEMRQAELQAPSLRRIILEDISSWHPYERIGVHPGLIEDRRENPLVLETAEKLNVYTIHTADGWALIWLADAPITPVRGDIRTVKCLPDAGTTADVWENRHINLQQTLPAGRYQVVGAKAIGTGLMAARLCFVGEPWRPGVPASKVPAPLDVTATPSETTIEAAMQEMLSLGGFPMFRKGKFGVFGEFEFDQPPSVDLLQTAACDDCELYLDLIQIRAGR